MTTKTLAQQSVQVKRITIQFPIEIWRAARKFTAPPLEEGPSFKSMVLEGLQLAIEKHESELKNERPVKRTA